MSDYRISIGIQSVNHAVREYWVTIQDRPGGASVKEVCCFTETEARQQMADWREELNSGWCP